MQETNPEQEVIQQQEIIRQQEIVSPFTIKYTGRLTDSHIINSNHLALSILGASKISTSIIHYVFTGKVPRTNYKKEYQCVTEPPKMGSYEWIQWIIPIVPLAVEDPFSLKLGVEMLFQATWDYIVKKLTHSPTDFASQPLLEICGKNTEALYDAFRLFLYTTEKQNRNLTNIALGLTDTIEKLDKHYNETISDLAEANKTNVINFVQPILGNSCTHINNNFNNGFNLEIDPAVADVINSTEKDIVGSRTDYECIKITELNLTSGHCILEISGFDNKVIGQISDPVLGQPNNIYSTALNEWKSIILDAKPIIRDGQVIKLHISDAYLENHQSQKS